MIEKLGIEDHNFISSATSPDNKGKNFSNPRLPQINYRTIQRWKLEARMDFSGDFFKVIWLCCIWFIFIRSTPIIWSVFWCFWHSLSCFPMLISKIITNSIHLSSGTQQSTIITISLDISEWKQKHAAE